LQLVAHALTDEPE